MPIFAFSPLKASYNSTEISLVDPYLTLRKQDAQGNYDRIGTYPLSSDVIFENYKAKSLTELFSFALEIDNEELCGVQLSNNDGASWLFWDGSTWATAGANDFSSVDEIDANIASFPFTFEKQIKPKIRLYSNTAQKVSPRLGYVFLGLELSYDALEDAVRTIKHAMERDLSFNLDFRCKLSKDTNKVTLKSNFEILNTEFRAFNLTNDPGKLDNIFQSYNPENNLVYFTATQSMNSVILIEYKGKCKIYIGADEEFIVSELPSLVMTYSPTTYDRRLGGQIISEVSRGKKKARYRYGPEFLNFPLVVSCQAAFNWESLRMSKAVNNFFERGKIISEAMGQEIRLIWPQEKFSETDVLARGLFKKDVTVTVHVKEWVDSYIELPLAEEISLRWGDKYKVWDDQKI
jgi:hypothetical protein